VAARKTLTVAEKLREEIAQGVWLPGERIPSARELAQSCGVSLSPVLKALQTLEREGLIERIPRVGTFVARRRAKRGLLGLITSDCDGEDDAQLIRGFEHEATRLGHAVVFGNARRDPEAYALRVARCVQHNVLGVAFVPTEGSFLVDWNKAFYGGLRDKGMHVVALRRQPFTEAGQPRISAVVPDGYWQGRCLASHLMDLGHRRLGFLYGRWSCTVEERKSGVSDEARARGLPQPDVRTLSPEELASPGGIFDVSEIIRQWRRASPPITAVVCVSDHAAKIFYEHAHALRLRIPDDMAVVSVGDLSFAALLDPPLTTIRISYAELGRAGAELLVSQLSDPTRPSRIVMTRGELIVRASCGAKRHRRTGVPGSTGAGAPHG